MEQPEFGAHIRSLRQARGLSQAEVAGSAMSISYLSRIESGARPPTAKTIDYLSERLGVPVAALSSPPANPLLKLIALITSGDLDDATVARLRDAVADDDIEPEVRWQGYWLLADALARRGLLAQEREVLRSVDELGDTIKVPELSARVCTRLARCERSLGNVAEAHLLAQRALQTAQDNALAVPDIARPLMILISAEAELGRLPKARELADRLTELVAGTSGVLRVEALWTTAQVSMRQGDIAAARQAIESALDVLSSHDDLMLWLRVRLAAASLYLQVSPADPAAAARRLDEAEPAVQLIGRPLHDEEFRLLRAAVAFEQGDLPTAQALCDRLEDSHEHLTFRDQIRLGVLANRLRIMAGDRETGIANISELAQRTQEAMNIDLTAEIWRTLAETLAATPPAR
ncbi:hypothetical protein GCM10009661_62180 [Catellatospora chokoriensis]|uniref:HTH cro/C1-type domain-containing protein n=1 Tax=Catellatospora chokoriensis TaxID=310353 RepID=A0A8J3K6F7_9ACTN|nr:helix-turn-helix domain-containing protein [Catellatospora chokoriensis]GIF90319.1 hypothetical protein Cch02nite_37630 [Catellatospora chokoriensis]